VRTGDAENSVGAMSIAAETTQDPSLAGHPFVMRLSRLMEFSAADLENLERIVESERLVKRRQDLVVIGSAYRSLCFVKDGHAIRYKLLRSGMEPAYAFTPPGVANYPGGAKPYWAGWPLARRQTEARRLLGAAGYSRAHPLKLEIKHRSTSDPTLFMPAIQADWRNIGVEATLAPNEGAIAYQAYRIRDFEVV